MGRMIRRYTGSILIVVSMAYRIGLRNVHQRLRMIYGEGSGLEIQSEEGKGTVVSLQIRAGGGMTDV